MQLHPSCTIITRIARFSANFKFDRKIFNHLHIPISLKNKTFPFYITSYKFLTSFKKRFYYVFYIQYPINFKSVVV